MITGAGKGIGRALAKLLAQEGYAIAAVGRHEETLSSLADELQAQQKPVAWSVADVTKPAGLFQATRDLEAQLGPIDLFVANAGIGFETTALNYNIEDMNKIITIDLIGFSNSIGAVLPGMVERKRGHLVAISSFVSYRGMPRLLAYSASKAGMNAIMDGLRVELAPMGIFTTTICPGWVRTEMTDKIEGELYFLMEVENAAREIFYAIRTKKSFYTFPRSLRWGLQVLTLLPRAWQDWYLRREMMKLQVNQDKQAQDKRNE